MHHLVILAAAAAIQPQVSSPEAGEEPIIVTASREPVAAGEAGVSVTLFSDETLEALAFPMTSDILRLSPGISVSTSGSRGTQTDLRVRGAEANHTLLFVDGIRFNDPAAGNIGRFEFLTNDALSRVEVVRGPQSALWGSDALGGVVAVESGERTREHAFDALLEYGSLDSVRASLQGAVQAGSLALSGGGGYVRSEGIDIFSEEGEHDGFDIGSANLKAVVHPYHWLETGVVGHWTEGTSEFDGYDATGFADTLDATDNRIFALRGWSRAELGGWTLSSSAAYLDSENRNRVGDTPINDTFGDRLTVGAQATRAFGGHRFTAALEREEEDFSARDKGYFGGTDQERSRALNALVGQWRAGWSGALATDFTIRHDDFSEYTDATTLRALALVKPLSSVTLHAAYGEGISRPTFYDLYGFFPGSFIGNPDLRPERSRGIETGLRWAQGPITIGVTGFSNRLTDEIFEIYHPDFTSTTANAQGKSRRRGVELDARYRIRTLDIGANYTFLDADEQKAPDDQAVREARRPQHSANLFTTSSLGPVEIGGSLAYVGKRREAAFPADVTLNDYLLASLRVGYRLTRALEAYARLENGFDADYQDALGYNTPGRTIYAGIRARLGN